jgi:hypothetical protein
MQVLFIVHHRSIARCSTDHGDAACALLRRPHHHGRDVWPCVLLAGHIVFCTMNRHFMNPQPCDYCKRRLSRSVRLQMGIRSVALYESERLADSAHIRRMKLPDTSDLESDCTTTELQIPNDFCQSTRPNLAHK